MSSARFVMVLLPLTTSLVLLATVTYFVSRGGCPEGYFNCGNKSICVQQRSICDGKLDCPNGEDEDAMYCADLHGGFWEIVENLKYKTPNDTCELDGVIDGCRCRDRTVLVCRSLGWTSIPDNMSSTATRLILADNNIKLEDSSFDSYSLKMIHLGRNGLTALPANAFRNQTELEKLFLSENLLSELPSGLLKDLYSLRWLFLNDNRLVSLHLESWNLDSLFWLEMSRNCLTLENEVFPNLPSLSLLYLDSNLIEVITDKTFANLVSLKDLSLKRNNLRRIDAQAFSNQVLLQDLDLAYNKLESLDDGLFAFGKKLQKLSLAGNPVTELKRDLFKSLTSLKSLDLEDIEIENIDIAMFSLLDNLDFVYFKKFKYCTFAPKVPKCAPATDGVSSVEDLLAEKLIRIVLWVVASFILVTNSMVLWRRTVANGSQASPLNLVITNLAVADLLMGVYLSVIGYQDLRFRGIYKEFAHAWMSSWSCTATGIIAMLSSEVSVLILLLISAERFLLIASPLRHQSSLSLKAALGSVTSIWIFAITVALIPVVHWRHTVRFYGSNSLCFPLHIDEPYFAGWQYSTFVFIGINSAGLVGIGILYTAVFLSIWKTQKATTISMPDSDFALRFFFIFLTNASCWVPIIILKCMAFFEINFSGELYSWLAVFVIPVNSAVNPILYTFTAPNYRSMLNHFKINRNRQYYSNQATDAAVLSTDCTKRCAVLTAKFPITTVTTLSTNYDLARNTIEP